ncbi:hypothetical protein M407DRAFT_33205 [Tulasnella calospora MUT 4182]|uniref:Uncharacterized protein n=1 Tax=Tulasnella calospora MUT 4182 TaxID=1051891 RepID=A0A0C3PR94_9AGAM|nr:hypothetical protein M407DRAFT_33205 [Tulasnella calospora MUT 4182]
MILLPPGMLLQRVQRHPTWLLQEDIVKYLHHTSRPKSGNWSVVVSQRGIKRMREYLADKKEIFLRVETKIKYLVMLI